MNKNINAQILFTARKELSWSHIKRLIYFKVVGKISIVQMTEMFKYNSLLLIITSNNKLGEI